MRVRLIVASLAVLTAAACQQTPEPVKDWNTVSMRLERGPCMGGCPIYSVEISGDGAVTYEGVNFVAVAGKQTAQVSPEAARGLFAKFEAAKFDQLKPEYRSDMTDGVTNRLTLKRDGVSRTVVNYMGWQAGMPQSVSELEAAIDVTAGTKKWVGDNAM